MITIFLIAVPVAVVAFFIGMSVGWHKAESVKPKPYVPPVTYTVIGAEWWKIYDDMRKPEHSRVFIRYETRISVISSKGDIKTHHYEQQKFTKKQIEHISLESNWLYDENLINFNSINR